MSQNPYSMTQPRSAVAVNSFVANVFGWMSAALLLTAVVATLTAYTGLTHIIIAAGPLFFGLLIGELVLVVVLGRTIHSLAPATAAGMFVLYSALNGLTLSVIFLIYTKASIGSTFFVTSATFALTAGYGYVTKRDLTTIGSLCFMLLIGLILASVVNWFLASEAMHWAITYAGVAIFVGLTAYDTQKIRLIGESVDPSSPEGRKGAIHGALHLYLDFINLFLLLLRIFGRRR